MLNFLEERGLDVSTADNGNGEPGLGQRLLMKQPGCGRHSAARFGNGLWIRHEYSRRVQNLLFADGDDVVDIAPDMFKRERADVLRPQSVGDGLQYLFGRKPHDLARAKAGLGILGQFGFNAKNLYIRARL